MNVGRQPGAPVTVVIGLDAVGAGAGGGVEVNADEDGVAMRVGDGDACWQRHEKIAVACHDYLVTSLAQFFA